MTMCILLIIFVIVLSLFRMRKIIDVLEMNINMRGQYNVVDMSRIDFMENKVSLMAKKLSAQNEVLLEMAAKIDELEKKLPK